jgi:hypothetical protein
MTMFKTTAECRMLFFWGKTTGCLDLNIWKALLLQNVRKWSSSVIPKQNGILNHTTVKISKLMPLNCSITNLKMYAWHPFHLTLSNTAKYMTNSVYKNVCSILPCNFYMKCFNPINYFVNFGMDTQTRKFIQCHLTGAFTKLWKAPVSFAMPAYLSICMNEFCYHWKDFCEIILQTFSKNCQENSSLVKIRQIYQHFTWRSKYIL